MDFIQFMNPNYEANWHHHLVATALERVLRKQCRRLMIFEPPQNGKSEQVSRNFPAFAFGRNPDLRIIACSYNASLAQDMSRDVQKIMTQPVYTALFPKTRLATSSDIEKRTQGQFDIVGRAGRYFAEGVDGSITGKSADIGIIDDPIKNRAEAESKTYRDKIWDWYKTAFTTRQFGDQGAIIICLTRWHQDDLAGRLIKLAEENEDADQWEVLDIPAICDRQRIWDPREIGEVLWPEKYPLAELRRRKAALGEYDWSALYQQEPSPPGGGLIKEVWFAGKIVAKAPALARRCRAWDTAATERAGDYSVGARVSEHQGKFYIEDIHRDQYGPGDLDKAIRLCAEVDGKNTWIREEYTGAAGKIAIDLRQRDLKRTMPGYNFDGVSAQSKSKVERSREFRKQAELGNVYLVQGPWIAAFLDEAKNFPTGATDDQVDAVSHGINTVLTMPPPVIVAPTGVGSGRSYWGGPQ